MQILVKPQGNICVVMALAQSPLAMIGWIVQRASNSVSLASA